MKRVSAYFDGDLQKALKMKSAVKSISVSERVNDAVRSALREKHPEWLPT
ncbi:hypothetical protein HZ994_05925 [Akkermansiaceae bacterium]|nr:hypothetical protein HZ994_05925 [Akkermansiaceae bacterium]